MTGNNLNDADFDYDPSHVIKSLPVDPHQALQAASSFLNIVSNKTVMSSLETVLRESYKFIRLADDLHDIKWYLNDIRLCFVALTISGYVGLILYGIILCVTKRRRGGANTNESLGASAPRPSLPSGGRMANHRQSYGGGGALYDEEMNYGWKSDDGVKFNSSRTPNEAQNRYATRSLNRNTQQNYYNPKLDSVDSPSKKLLLENHNALSGVIVSEISPTQPSNVVTSAATRENGGVGHRM